MANTGFLNDWNNVVSPGRNELVFEDKNKSYGAYVIRKEYNKNVIKALVIACVSLVLLVSIPKIIELLGKAQEEEVVVPVDITAVDLAAPPPIDETEPPPPPPPPPPVMETIKFTPPVVTDEEVIDEPPPVQTEETPQISTETQEGTGEELIIIPEETGTGVVEQEEQIFTFVEQPASFPGGDAALYKYLQDNIKFPALEKENGISGTVYLTFVVDKEGKVTDVKELRGVKGGAGLTREAIRVVKAMPAWNVGKQNGRPVKVQMNLPVKFLLK